jgi:hypothetical protein
MLESSRTADPSALQLASRAERKQTDADFPPLH